MILMQRLVTSSTRAIRTAIENRWQALQAQTVRPADNGGSAEEDWYDLDGQEQLEALESLPPAVLSLEQA